ncbi:MAG: deoxyribose-phosphate aldolase [Treponema sp.]|jgi:deoxyribose-phosphate aldolase|nr:deoxyribose-phosphate aldolase [Treponema sp.]
MKPNKKAQDMNAAELAAYIDQSVLKPEFTQGDIKKYIQEGIDYGCKTVCINPASLDIARGMCKGTKTGLCVVCDFPFGLSVTASKVMQINEICKNGDIEDLDIVSNYGWIRSGLWAEFESEIRALAEAAHKHGTLLKVIFETDALTMDEVARATDICCKAGVDYVKTSTGFYTGGENKGTTFEVVKVMMDAAQGRCKIKGAGGIRDREKFLKLIDLGIDRMGIGFKSTPVVLGIKV